MKSADDKTADDMFGAEYEREQDRKAMETAERATKALERIADGVDEIGITLRTKEKRRVTQPDEKTEQLDDKLADLAKVGARMTLDHYTGGHGAEVLEVLDEVMGFFERHGCDEGPIQDTLSFGIIMDMIRNVRDRLRESNPPEDLSKQTNDWAYQMKKTHRSYSTPKLKPTASRQGPNREES